MEIYLQNQIDKYPTGSIFLLKSSHGHQDIKVINVTNNNVTPEDVKDAVSKLGLDK